MTKSKTEINLNRLLFRIENRLSENKIKDSWRIDYFLKDSELMLAEIINEKDIRLLPEEETKYQMRLDRAKKIFEASMNVNVFEEHKIIDQIPLKSDTFASVVSLRNEELNLKSRMKCDGKIRNELFGKVSIDHNSESENENVADDDDDKRLDHLDDSIQSEILSKNEDTMETYIETLFSISRQFKQQLLTSGEIIRKDTAQIDNSTDIVSGNETKLKTVNMSLSNIIKTSWMWGNWILVAIAFLMFMATIVFIKIF